jgi:hypothetical protein
MNRCNPRARTSIVLLCGVLLCVSAWAQPDAGEVMRRNFFATKLSGFSGDVTLTLINSRGDERVRKMSIRSKLKENGVDSAVMTRFEQPNDIKGTGFLQSENSAGDDDIWVYLPALGKTRRLASNNKRDSFFGTDFAYGDILLPAVKTYKHTLLRTEILDDENCYVIESYDIQGALLKTQLVSQAREVEPEKQRWLALERRMTNHQTGHRTVYRIDDFQVGNVTGGGFSVRDLEAR